MMIMLLIKTALKSWLKTMIGDPRIGIVGPIMYYYKQIMSNQMSFGVQELKEI